MIFQLLRDVAPRTVDRFLGLVRTGFYDGLSFHRVADLLGGGRGWVARGSKGAGGDRRAPHAAPPEPSCAAAGNRQTCASSGPQSR